MATSKLYRTGPHLLATSGGLDPVLDAFQAQEAG